MRGERKDGIHNMVKSETLRQREEKRTEDRIHTKEEDETEGQ